MLKTTEYLTEMKSERNQVSEPWKEGLHNILDSIILDLLRELRTS